MASDEERDGLDNLNEELDKDDDDLAADQATVDLKTLTGQQLVDAKRLSTSCFALKQIPFGDLTKEQKKILKDEEHWNNIKKNFRHIRQLHTYGKSRKSKQGKNIACCGHLCIHGELHWFCHKCQIFSGFSPCCTQADRNSHCPAGRLMTMEAIKLRSTAITKINLDLKEGIVPGWRIFKQPTDDVNDGASTSQQSDTAMDTEDKNNNNINNESDTESAIDGDVTATTVRRGERKPRPTSTNCPPVIDRGDAGSYKNVMQELRKLGVPCVPLQPSADVVHFGVKLDEEWLDLIDGRLDELRTSWLMENADVDSLPPTEVLMVDAAPFDRAGAPLQIAPLQFPAVERHGVLPKAFNGRSDVRLTQQDLAGWEEQLKFVLHSLSLSKTLHTTAVLTHQKEREQRNTQQTDEPHAKTRRSSRRKTGSESATPTFEANPLEHVDAAATKAIDDAAKVVVSCLVDTVVARRRAILVPGAARKDKIAVLTRPITNTDSLA